MGLESKLLRAGKFLATGVVGTAALMATGYGLGELLQGTYVDTGVQYTFNTFKVEYNNLSKFATFTGFGTGLKMTAWLEFYNIYPKVKNAFKKVYNKTKGSIKKSYNIVEDQTKTLESKIKKSKKERLKSLGGFFLCAGIGLGFGKLIGEGFEHISYTNQAFTYLFNNFADLHFAELGDLFTLLGMVWGLKMKPQAARLCTYLTDKERSCSQQKA